MKRLMLWMVALAMVAGSALRAQDVAGTWQGTLHPTPGKEMRIVLKIAKAGNALSGTAYSIDSNGRPYRTSPIALQGGSIAFEVPGIGNSFGSKYEGRLSADGASMTGIWTLNLTALPLEFKHVTDATAWDIPAPPAPIQMMPADADPTFDVVTVKPNNSGVQHPQGLVNINGRRYSGTNVSLGDLLRFSYDLQAKEILNAPDWLDKDRYDLAGIMDPEGKPSIAQVQILLQKLMADRFQLKFHYEKRTMPAFVLAAAKSGPKLLPTLLDAASLTENEHESPGGMTMVLRNATLAELTLLFQGFILDRPVVNKTGIKGKYDFVFTFTPDDSMFGGHSPMNPHPDTAESAPSLFEVFQQQFGLKLTPEKTAVDVLVLDHVEKPSAN
jgi:uncharacterized protein (TIGR03435 family)